MQRQVRRQDRAIGSEEARGLLAAGDYGVLATVGDDGQPYAVPLSYALVENSLFFHCAREGHKLENIKANPAVSFCVVGATQTLPRQFGTEYESVVAFGRAREIFDEEKHAALVKILEKYSPDFIASGLKYIAGKTDATRVVRIDIEHLTGKARRAVAAPQQ
jgi:nitroimidazol reductase NimA-like FMN-containing flavoprotein (pyridoxamine 5'-phosphate oxidase superfamily)